MSYSHSLVERIRQILANVPGVQEKEKMGGVSFMKDGHVLVRAHSDGTMMLRCDPDMTDDLLQKPGAQRFTMKGKTAMRGWLLITADGTATNPDLQSWIDVALVNKS